MYRIRSADIHLIDLKTRLPFKYGIATMTEAPHAFVRVQLELDDKVAMGIAADHLPPKWFTKVPEKPLDEEIEEMLAVIEHAVEMSVGLAGESIFSVWKALYQQQLAWGQTFAFPPLLSNFGATLVERALIEATCKLAGKPFARMVRENQFGIELDFFDDALKGKQPADFLPKEPVPSVIARHTVGMADPLTEEEISEEDRLHDGLPQSLQACIGCYRLKHFKIKVSGQLEQDTARLAAVATVLNFHAPTNFSFTMDGNEQFRSLDQFQSYWEALLETKDLARLWEHLLFVEQPFHRDVALNEDVLEDLPQWADRPQLIIDESDAELDSLERALTLGYHGTSHKNCKGVFRGIASACKLESLRRRNPTNSYVMSGEDLANIGPVALLQDLTVAATLGVTSVERNGHHYFAGLSAFPTDVQKQVLTVHADLFQNIGTDWPALQIQDGELSLKSIHQSLFGVGFTLDVEQFLTVGEWRHQRASAEENS